MKTKNTISRWVTNLPVIAILFAFGIIIHPVFAQITPDLDENTAEKSSQLRLQNDPASESLNGILSINGITNGDFESGTANWVEYSTHGWDIIINSGFPGTVTPHSGSWATWFGGDYDDTSYIQQQITVPIGYSLLTYWHWIASADTDCGSEYDIAKIDINSTTIDEYYLCTTNNTDGWVEKTVDLSAYAGQSVTLQIRVETDGVDNSNLFIDDVTMRFIQVFLPILINQ